MKSVPNIKKYMTMNPKTIGFDQTLKKAEKIMNEEKIRHLPVLNGGKLVGILSHRDIKIVTSFKDVDPAQITVEEAYTPDPYFTNPEAKLNEVVEMMASHKYGCVLVTDSNKLVGIFTWVDALNAMKELLDKRFH
jgi:acetoin utilization protein AcuB